MKFRRNIDPQEALCIGSAALIKKIGEIHISYITKSIHFLTRMKNPELYRRGSGSILRGIERNIRIAANQRKLKYKELRFRFVFFKKNKGLLDTKLQEQLSDYLHENLWINTKNEDS